MKNLDRQLRLKDLSLANKIYTVHFFRQIKKEYLN